MGNRATTLIERFRAAARLVLRGSSLFFTRPGLDAGSDHVSKMGSPYALSPWVQRAIKKVAGPISAVPLVFTSDTRGGDQLIDDPDLSAWWDEPAVGLSFSDFVEATVGWLKLAGESFWVLGDDAIAPYPSSRRRMAKMLVARPDRMRHVVVDGALRGWEFTDGANVRYRLLPEQVIQLKLWNPYDPWRGLAEYRCAELAAESDYAAGRFVLNMQQNNGDQGVYVIAKNGTVSDEQRTQIIQELRAKREMQQRGQFRPVFLTGDISIEDPRVRTPDAAFMASRLQNRHEIFLAFGVPPSMADVKAAYSIGSASDRFELIEETCMPTSEKIAGGVERVTRIMTGRQLYVAFDWDEHSTMQSVRAERIDSAVKLWNLGMPFRQVNNYLRLGAPEFEGDGTGYLPFSVSPVGDSGMEGMSEGDDGTDEVEDAPVDVVDEAGEDIKAALQGRMGQDGQDGRKAGEGQDGQDGEKAGCCCGGDAVATKEGEAFQRARDPKEIARWREQMAKRQKTAHAYRVRITKHLMAARREVLAKLDQTKGIKGKAGALDLLFDLTKWREGLLAALRPLSVDALMESGEQLFAEVGKDDPFSMVPSDVTSFVRQRENRLSDVADDVWLRIKREIQDGLDAGDSVADITSSVKGAFNELGRGRAQRIAMTETAAAYGSGRHAAMKQAGVQYKQWITSGLQKNFRATHAQANQQRVPIGEPFKVGGEPLMFPGDPNGSPGNVINCHCVSIAVKDQE